MNERRHYPRSRVELDAQLATKVATPTPPPLNSAVTVPTPTSPDLLLQPDPIAQAILAPVEKRRVTDIFKKMFDRRNRSAPSSIIDRSPASPSSTPPDPVIVSLPVVDTTIPTPPITPDPVPPAPTAPIPTPNPVVAKPGTADRLNEVGRKIGKNISDAVAKYGPKAREFGSKYVQELWREERDGSVGAARLAKQGFEATTKAAGEVYEASKKAVNEARAREEAKHKERSRSEGFVRELKKEKKEAREKLKASAENAWEAFSFLWKGPSATLRNAVRIKKEEGYNGWNFLADSLSSLAWGGYEDESGEVKDSLVRSSWNAISNICSYGSRKALLIPFYKKLAWHPNMKDPNPEPVKVRTPRVEVPKPPKPKAPKPKVEAPKPPEPVDMTRKVKTPREKKKTDKDIPPPPADKRRKKGVAEKLPSVKVIDSRDQPRSSLDPSPAYPDQSKFAVNENVNFKSAEFPEGMSGAVIGYATDAPNLLLRVTLPPADGETKKRTVLYELPASVITKKAKRGKQPKI